MFLPCYYRLASPWPWIKLSKWVHVRERVRMHIDICLRGWLSRYAHLLVIWVSSRKWLCFVIFLLVHLVMRMFQVCTYLCDHVRCIGLSWAMSHGQKQRHSHTCTRTHIHTYVNTDFGEETQYVYIVQPQIHKNIYYTYTYIHTYTQILYIHIQSLEKKHSISILSNLGSIKTYTIHIHTYMYTHKYFIYIYRVWRRNTVFLYCSTADP